MSEFKVGQKVKRVRSGRESFPNGDIGTIRYVHRGSGFLEFEEYPQGYAPKDRVGYTYDPDDFEAVNEIQKGDLVKRIALGNIGFPEFPLGATDVVASVDYAQGYISFESYPLSLSKGQRASYTFNLEHFEKVEPEEPTFKPGDKVRRLTTLSTLPGEEMNAGDVYTVSYLSPDGYNLYLSDAKYPHLGYSVVQFEKIEEKEEIVKETKFKVGDTVRRISHDWFGIKVGEIGVVSGVQGTEGITLEGRDGEYAADCFELVQAAPTLTLEAPLRENLRDLERQVSALRKQIRATHVLLAAEKEKK